jgi:two-component system, response regulator YesN
MRTVLIVDDELNICHLVQHLIDWDSLNLQCIGLITNCSDAYDIAIEKQPDIIITDIQMPGMTGLDLIEKLQSRGSKSKFIIFTGYKTFDYAYKAIKFGCNDFLLKPISKTELNDSLSSICQSFNQSKNADHNSAQNPNTTLRRHLLNNIAHNEIPRKITTLSKLNSSFAYDFKDLPLQIGIFWLSRGSFPDGFRNNILHKIARLMHVQIRPFCQEFEMMNCQGDILMILNYTEGAVAEILPVFLQKISVILEPYPFLHYVFGLGESVYDPTGLISSYKTARHAIESRVFMGYNCLIDANTTVLYTDSAEPPSNIYVWKEIDIALDILDRQRLADAIVLLCHQSMDYFKQCPSMIYDWYKSTAQSILKRLTENHIDYQQIIKQNTEQVYASIENCMDIDALTKCLKDFFLSTMEQYINVKKIDDIKTIQIAKTYIRENFYRQLELDDIANQVYLSPAYFGMLFKKETGMTFTNYILEKRMQKAKEYLQDLKYSINEIAGMVGYKDTKYFSRQFKKYVGINPAQYRNIHHFQYKGEPNE